jgi:predicted transcriptional regulator
MGRPARIHPPRLLTDVELELMSILWRLGEGTVRDVLAELPRNRKLAYTSVSTILRVLEGKRMVKSRKVGRSHTYLPGLSKPEYERRSIRHLVRNVFDGTPRAMVSRLVDDEGLTRGELEELQQLVERQLRERK